MRENLEWYQLKAFPLKQKLIYRKANYLLLFKKKKGKRKVDNFMETTEHIQVTLIRYNVEGERTEQYL